MFISLLRIPLVVRPNRDFNCGPPCHHQPVQPGLVPPRPRESLQGFPQEEGGNQGRILVRTSGTEPIIRVMVEGKDNEKVLEIANFLSNTIKKQLS